MTNHPGDVEELEVRAPSVSEAIQQGLIQLGVTRDDVEIDVLSAGSRGILGFIGAEDARVRLRLRRPRARQIEPEPGPQPAPEEPAVATPRPVALPEPPPVPERAPGPRPPARPEGEIDAVELALQTVRELVRRMGVSAAVGLRQRGAGTGEDPIIIDVTGEDLGAVIGQQGSTLQALQYITRVIVSRRTHEWTNIVVDAAGYRQRREDSLSELALRMADRVRQSGRPISLEPMAANERRIIHLTLRDAPDVTTRSVGEGDHRKVTIRPQR